ncbi:VCBS domain-containing protein [Bradyrhizobium sp. AZCC 1693]|uniref:VCBS domain-containing protein n=1 Tax=Bradyrhizobium sp. AZCC 1693 TaxID=3117029 RepID=UPI002FF1B0FE
MLVGSHAETGDERKAVAAPLPRIIGNVQTAAGFGTLRHATCTAAQVPVGDPRSRPDAGRFGMLWLTALTFSLTKKVQAADPNVTFLDDDNITYKDLEHGAFELVTKEAVPRRIIVADPGETIVLSRIGSSISVSPSANTRARMEELQEAQQDVLANLAKGLGPAGSSTPPFVNQLPAQRINFIQTDTSTTPNFLPPPEWINIVAPEIVFGKLPPMPPTLNAVSGPTEIDTVVFDAFTATSGTFVASSPRSDATLVYSIGGGTTGITVLEGVTYDISKTGLYGTLFVNSTTGAYTYVPNSDAINALTAPTTESFTVTVSDGTLSANQTFTITINGVNDAAVISGTTTGAVIEASGAAPGMPAATGTLTDTDVDNTPNTFTAVSSPTASAGGYGTFTITAAGAWTYTLNNANSTVQALNVGDTLTDTFTVTTIDGTAQVVTITITGANDAAVISGTTTGSVIETGATPGTPTATGTLTDSDVDNTPNTFTAVSSPAASAGGYGTFTMTAAGVWTYMLDDTNSVVQALDVGDTLTDTFTVTAVDGTAQQVTITIHGASDADPNDFDYLATGTVVISDLPFVYGTPRGDSIAGGGNDGQIIYGGAGDDTLNGTGKGDNVYGGSGNDTIKGNDGDDTIYGGSGSDTINANNGNDTIIGGFGSDLLTGSNGDDRFVYLSVADSNAAQFDVISDFRSGSDRIDLAALGALAFLALNFASTSVPPHTIAWIYDSAANETIVYVNSTDQTLTIGSSGLLEIHLQGIVSVEASDFVYTSATASAPVVGEPVDLALIATAAGDDETIATATTTEASSDWTVRDGALLADWNWTVRTVGERNSFDFASDGDARTYSTGSTNDDAAIATLTSGPPIEVHHGDFTTPVEKNFVLDQKPVLDTKIHGANFAALNDLVMPSQVVKDAAIADDAQRNANHGGPHSGAPKVHGNGGDDHHSNSGEANKHETAYKHGASDVEPATAYAASGSAAAHQQGHGDSFHFKDEMSGPKASDVVEKASEMDAVIAPISPSDKTAAPDDPSTVSEIAQLIEPSPSKHHLSDYFNHGGGHIGNGHAHAALDLIV